MMSGVAACPNVAHASLSTAGVVHNEHPRSRKDAASIWRSCCCAQFCLNIAAGVHGRNKSFFLVAALPYKIRNMIVPDSESVKTFNSNLLIRLSRNDDPHCLCKETHFIDALKFIQRQITSGSALVAHFGGHMHGRRLTCTHEI